MNEENKTMVSELTLGWQKLRYELKKDRKIDFEDFESVFSKTYKLFSDFIKEDKVDKSYIEVISTAYIFANSDSRELENKYRAALALTERMISCCAFNSAVLIGDGTPIYVFETRKDTFINFTEVIDSLEKLEKLFEEEYWRNQ